MPLGSTVSRVSAGSKPCHRLERGAPRHPYAVLATRTWLRRGMLLAMKAQSTGSRRQILRSLWRVPVAVMTLLALMADGGISSDELACEQATVQIQTCCPELSDVSYVCVRSGCGGSMVPELDEDRSSCLRGKSCEALRALGVCDPATWEAPPVCASSPCTSKVPKCQ